MWRRINYQENNQSIHEFQHLSAGAPLEFLQDRCKIVGEVPTYFV